MRRRRDGGRQEALCVVRDPDPLGFSGGGLLSVAALHGTTVEVQLLGACERARAQ